jgi:hypothetical protein
MMTAVGIGHDANGRKQASSERRIHSGASGRGVWGVPSSMTTPQN